MILLLIGVGCKILQPLSFIYMNWNIWGLDAKVSLLTTKGESCVNLIELNLWLVWLSCGY